MWLLITSCVGFLLSNCCLASVSNEPSAPVPRCRTLGDKCRTDSDCCSDFTCQADQAGSVCLLSSLHRRVQRNADESIVPPYYHAKNQLYPYGINQPALAFHKAHDDGRKLEWDHCRFHEECGDGNCCYVHFRFRSLPKWFCRPNRNELTSLCEPLTKYRSLKDVPAWQTAQAQEREPAGDEQRRR